MSAELHNPAFLRRLLLSRPNGHRYTKHVVAGFESRDDSFCSAVAHVRMARHSSDILVASSRETVNRLQTRHDIMANADMVRARRLRRVYRQLEVTG